MSDSHLAVVPPGEGLQDGQGQAAQADGGLQDAAQAIAVVAQDVRLGGPPMAQAQVYGGLQVVAPAIAVVAPEVRRDGAMAMNFGGRMSGAAAVPLLQADENNQGPGGFGNASFPNNQQPASAPRRGVGEDQIAAGQAAEAAKTIADVARSADDDIMGADGEYPSLPDEHQISYHAESFDAQRPCLFGGAKHVADSEEWKRLEISAQERAWKSCVSPNFRVVENNEPNTCRHLYHAGPHVSMVFDITQQNTPEAGLNPRVCGSLPSVLVAYDACSGLLMCGNLPSVLVAYDVCSGLLMCALAY